MRPTVLILTLAAGVAAASGASAERYRGALTCGDGADAFTGERTVTVADGAVAYAAKPSAKTQERWRGTAAADGAVYVIGAYSWSETKPLFFLGRASDGRLILDGWRGPKRCRFDGALITTPAAKPSDEPPEPIKTEG